jgi:hypothetical protein
MLKWTPEGHGVNGDCRWRSFSASGYLLTADRIEALAVDATCMRCGLRQAGRAWFILDDNGGLYDEDARLGSNVLAAVVDMPCPGCVPCP